MTRVLIAEDEVLVSLALLGMLTDQGHIVRRAADGAEAIKILSEFEAEVLVTDLTMPRVCGVRLIRYLDSMPGPLRPVALITGIPQRRLPEGLRYDVYIGKPVDFEAVGCFIDGLPLRTT